MDLYYLSISIQFSLVNIFINKYHCKFLAMDRQHIIWLIFTPFIKVLQYPDVTTSILSFRSKKMLGQRQKFSSTQESTQTTQNYSLLKKMYIPTDGKCRQAQQEERKSQLILTLLNFYL